MNPIYQINDTTAIYTPALVFYRELIQHNLALAIKMAGGPQRLRPHVKTHKTREIARMRKERLIVTVSTDGDEAMNDEIRGIDGGWRRQIETFLAPWLR